MRRWGQYRVFRDRGGHGVRKPRQWLPRGAARYVWTFGNKLLTVEWRIGYGVYAVAIVHDPWASHERIQTLPYRSHHHVKKRQLMGGPDAPRPALSGESVVFRKFPKICEFLTAVYYEDNTVRTPGALRITVQGLSFAITLSDPDALCRLTIRGGTLDETLALAETALKQDDLPWEVDTFALERESRKKKK